MIVRKVATSSSWYMGIDHPVPINRDTPPLQEGSRHSEQILNQRANSPPEKGEYRAAGRGFFSISTSSSWYMGIDHPVSINRDTPPLQEGSRHSEQILNQRANSPSEKGEYRAAGRGYFSISTNLVVRLRTIIFSYYTSYS
jgi:hypothetical protein